MLMLTSRIARKAFPFALALILLSQTLASSRIYGSSDTLATGYRKHWHRNSYFSASALLTDTASATVTSIHAREPIEVNRHSAPADRTTTATAAHHRSLNLGNGIIKQTGLLRGI